MRWRALGSKIGRSGCKFVERSRRCRSVREDNVDRYVLVCFENGIVSFMLITIGRMNGRTRLTSSNDSPATALLTRCSIGQPSISL